MILKVLNTIITLPYCYHEAEQKIRVALIIFSITTETRQPQTLFNVCSLLLAVALHITITRVHMLEPGNGKSPFLLL